ncbi:hypothetical protein [Alicyclobacillus kakegawensis]|uniref:hypothetical protein n=1 Tax=Alicyclobacillus kakegawensis TaxID=392012 RepID=UPI0012EE7FC4|nr:hypothetical protein [Alicyclobacillus kakegawensis]
MNASKIWVITGTLIVLMALIGIGMTLWNEVREEWDVEQSAAQYALNHSPLERIEGHALSTGAGVQEVFYGRDMFGRSWYTFVTDNPRRAYAVPASQVLAKSKVEQLAERAGVTPIDAEPAYVPSSLAKTLPASRHVVWEVYGRQRNSGRSEYIFYDAVNGKRLWQYVLST